MQDNFLDNRWYDRDPRMAKVLELIRDLPDDTKEELAVNLIEFVNIIRKNRSELENPLSIGKTRVLGLYKAFNKRRWYDKNSVLMSAMNVLSTLPLEDCRNITQGILLTLSNSNVNGTSLN